jgi:hypothetical protein
MNQAKTTGFEQALRLVRDRSLVWGCWIANFGGPSVLPTVWSNCLSGWWFAGGEHFGALAALLTGVSFLFIGGAFLRYADAGEGSAAYTPAPGIGTVYWSSRHLWLFSLGWFAVGLVILVFLGKTAAVLALLLSTMLVVYVTSAGVAMATPVSLFFIRFLLYLLAGSIGPEGITGECMWSGLALGFYMAGIGLLTVKGSVSQVKARWPGLLLLVPVMLAWLYSGFTLRNVLLSTILLLWIGWGLRYWYRSPQPNIPYTHATLLTGVVLVDLTATYAESGLLVVVFGALFLLSLWLYRYFPLTKVF